MTSVLDLFVSTRPHRNEEGLRSRPGGACTGLIDGKRIIPCLTLAVMKDGAEIPTIEGSPRVTRASAAGNLHRARCVSVWILPPGQICSAVGLMSEGKPGRPMTSASS